MPQTVEEVMDAALGLSEPERAELAEMLAASLATQRSLHPTWGVELARRAEEVDSGQVRTVPWEEVRRQAQAQLDAGGPKNG